MLIGMFVTSKKAVFCSKGLKPTNNFDYCLFEISRLQNLKCLEAEVCQPVVLRFWFFVKPWLWAYIIRQPEFKVKVDDIK